MTPEDVEEFLEGLSLPQALQERRVFLCDLTIVDGIPNCGNDNVEVRLLSRIWAETMSIGSNGILQKM